MDYSVSLNNNLEIDKSFYYDFTPFSILFKLNHGDSSHIHDPRVNKPVLGYELCLYKRHAARAAATEDRTKDARFQVHKAYSATADSLVIDGRTDKQGLTIIWAYIT